MADLFETTGELFMVGYPGTDPRAAAELIQRYHVGGIILFSRNIRDANHAREVCGTLQELRREVSDSPLFIAIDQEGGCVCRLTEGVTVFPGNMALGAVGSEDRARRVAEITADELSALGINVNFAPVLDICSNPRNPGMGARSFGSHPETVARLGSAMIEGMQQTGVMATAKHFPGLGEAEVDSHDELPTVTATHKVMEKRELLPFQTAIGSDVACIMTAHCSYPSLDATLNPATLSKPILNGLLRERMGFGGIVITDCLEMAAIEKHWSTTQAAVASVRAGATMALICHTQHKQIAAIEALAHAEESGDIAADIIRTEAHRIQTVKKGLGFPDSAARRSFIRQEAFSEELATESVTITRNKNSVLPLWLEASEKLAVIVPAFDVLTQVEDATEPHKDFLEELRNRHSSLLYQRIPVEPSSDDISTCVETCATSDKLLVLTYNAHRYPSQIELVDTVLHNDPQAIVAAVRDPFDLALLPQATTCIATYGFRTCSLTALVRVLFGEVAAKGTLPIEFD
jgi:beta-N-acetylhexosaminidase